MQVVHHHSLLPYHRDTVTKNKYKRLVDYINNYGGRICTDYDGQNIKPRPTCAQIYDKQGKRAECAKFYQSLIDKILRVRYAYLLCRESECKSGHGTKLLANV